MSQNADFRKVMPWVVFLSLMFFMNYTGRSIIGPLLVYVEHDLGLDHSQATGLLMYMSAGFSLTLLLSGFLPARFKPRKIVAISCGGMGAMLIILAQSQSFFSLKFFITLSGCFTGLYFTSAMASMGAEVSKSNWSKAIAIHEFGPALSFIFAPLVAEFGVRLTGSWRGALMIWGCASLVLSLLYFLLVRKGSQRIDPPSIKGLGALIRNPYTWFLCWCLIGGIAGEFAAYNVLSLHLTFERGLDSETANKLLSASRLASPAAIILGGFITPRLGVLNTLRMFFLLQGLCLILMGTPFLGVAVGAMFAQAMMPSFAWPAILSILPDRFQPSQQPTVISLTMPLAAYVGVGLCPKLLGIIGDNYSFSLGFVIFGCISLLTLPVCSVLKRTE